MVDSNRPYRSSLRAGQARTTRRAIVEAGAALFVERGYAGTTVDAIAERAGVSRKTVFTSVGGKVGLLKLAIDWALTGDDEPVALDDRPVVRELVQETDPQRAVVQVGAHGDRHRRPARPAPPGAHSGRRRRRAGRRAQRSLRAQPAGRSHELRRAAARAWGRSAAT